MSYSVIEVKKHKDIKRFLSLPKTLYSKENCPQNKDREKRILSKTHVLSQDFEIFPYIVLNKKQIVARCILTSYPNDNTAFVGFFESVNDKEPVQLLFNETIKKAKSLGKTEIIGPIDCSIFIGYRFKIDKFDTTYTGEPYNMPYYAQLWEDCGFTIKDKYVSNQLRTVQVEDCDSRLQRIYELYKDKGYSFVNPSEEDFGKHLRNIYQLLINLYSGFSGFHSITEKQFVSMFSYLSKIANYDMVDLVYKDDELRAFCVALPNYGFYGIGDLTVSKAMEIIKIKMAPKEYVILYVGASNKSAGLGGALIQKVRGHLIENGCTSIGALIKEGNVTGKLYSDLYVDTFHYRLYKMDI